MKKILILGSAGMLGHVVLKYFQKINTYEIFDSSYPNKFRDESYVIDVLNRNEITNLLEKISPDIVINCIGVLIKGSSSDPANAIYINSYLPHYISKVIKKWGGKLIHISTDCVFSGEQGGYSEFDFKNADNVYGRSKSLGEVINDYDLTIRTSIIGPELKTSGEGLFHWLLNQEGDIFGFSRVFWSGVTTLELARTIHYAINQNINGIINLPSKQKISKYELLVILKEVFDLKNINIIPNSDKKEDKSLVSLRKDFDFEVKDYNSMLLDLHDFTSLNADLYKHYNIIKI